MNVWYVRGHRNNKHFKMDKFGNVAEYNFNIKVKTYRTYKIEGDKIFLKESNGKRYLKIDNCKLYESKYNCSFTNSICYGYWH
jgi:hypothetical protein